MTGLANILRLANIAIIALLMVDSWALTTMQTAFAAIVPLPVPWVAALCLAVVTFSCYLPHRWEESARPLMMLALLIVVSYFVVDARMVELGWS